ncbi:MAG: hypothetical protein A2Y14_04555 [Verrucomicrobia bacterium GWF2_51_19]|nr:MAG: hypothetical protein A2Y14_04555 [Verrucomicrobia bacterium GWF2_51_19]
MKAKSYSQDFVKNVKKTRQSWWMDGEKAKGQSAWSTRNEIFIARHKRVQMNDLRYSESLQYRRYGFIGASLGGEL